MIDLNLEDRIILFSVLSTLKRQAEKNILFEVCKLQESNVDQGRQ